MANKTRKKRKRRKKRQQKKVYEQQQSGLEGIAPETLGQASNDELGSLDRQLHEAWSRMESGERINREELVNRHVFVLKEMEKRGLAHSFDDGLDKQTSALIGREKVLLEAEELSVAERIFREAKPFVWVESFISLSGSTLYARNREPRDTDLVVRASDLDPLVENEVAGALREAADNIGWICEPRGPNARWLPLWDLVCVPSGMKPSIPNPPSVDGRGAKIIESVHGHGPILLDRDAVLLAGRGLHEGVDKGLVAWVPHGAPDSLRDLKVQRVVMRASSVSPAFCYGEDVKIRGGLPIYSAWLVPSPVGLRHPYESEFAERFYESASPPIVRIHEATESVEASGFFAVAAGVAERSEERPSGFEDVDESGWVVVRRSGPEAPLRASIFTEQKSARDAAKAAAESEQTTAWLGRLVGIGPADRRLFKAVEAFRFVPEEEADLDLAALRSLAPDGEEVITEAVSSVADRHLEKGVDYVSPTEFGGCPIDTHPVLVRFSGDDARCMTRRAFDKLRRRGLLPRRESVVPSGQHAHPHGPDGQHAHIGLPPGGSHKHDEDGPPVTEGGGHSHRPGDPIDGWHLGDPEDEGQHVHILALRDEVPELWEWYQQVVAAHWPVHKWLDGHVRTWIRHLELEPELRESTEEDWKTHCLWSMHSAGHSLQQHIAVFLDPSSRFLERVHEFEDGTQRPAAREDFEKEVAWLDEHLPFPLEAVQRRLSEAVKLRALKVPDPEFVVDRLSTGREAILLSRVDRSDLQDERWLLVDETDSPMAHGFVSFRQEPRQIGDVGDLGDRIAALDEESREEFESKDGPFFVLDLDLRKQFAEPVELENKPSGKRFGAEVEIPTSIQEAADAFKPISFLQADRTFEVDDPSSIDEVWDEWAKPVVVSDDRVPIASEPLLRGARITLHRNRESTRILLGPDGKDVSGLHPDLTEEFLEAPAQSVVLDAVAVVWSDDGPVSAEETNRILRSETTRGLDLRVAVFDVLILDGLSLSETEWAERQEVLESLYPEEVDFGSDKPTAKIGRMPTCVAATKDRLAECVQDSASFPGSSGSVLRVTAGNSSVRSLTEEKTTSWALVVVDQKQRSESVESNLLEQGSDPGEEIKVEQDLTTQEQLDKEMDRVGNWYLAMQPDEPVPFVLQRHSRGILTPGSITEMTGRIEALVETEDDDEADEEAESIWTDFSLLLAEGEASEVREATDGVEDPSSTIDDFVSDDPLSADELIEALESGDLVARGNAHMDLRIDHPSGDFLLGWTNLTPGSVWLEIPDLDLEELQRNDFLEFDEESGGIAARQKTRQPPAWLDLVTKSEPRFWVEPGVVGATDETAGLFEFASKGRVVYGVQKSDFHEYFIFFDDDEIQESVGGRWTVSIVEGDRWLVRRTKDQKPFIFDNDLSEEVEQAKEEGVSLIWNRNAIDLLDALGFFEDQGLVEALSEFREDDVRSARPEIDVWLADGDKIPSLPDGVRIEEF